MSTELKGRHFSVARTSILARLLLGPKPETKQLWGRLPRKTAIWGVLVEVSIL